MGVSPRVHVDLARRGCPESRPSIAPFWVSRRAEIREGYREVRLKRKAGHHNDPVPGADPLAADLGGTVSCRMGLWGRHSGRDRPIWRGPDCSEGSSAQSGDRTFSLPRMARGTVPPLNACSARHLVGRKDFNAGLGDHRGGSDVCKQVGSGTEPNGVDPPSCASRWYRNGGRSNGGWALLTSALASRG